MPANVSAKSFWILPVIIYLAVSFSRLDAGIALALLVGLVKGSILPLKFDTNKARIEASLQVRVAALLAPIAVLALASLGAWMALVWAGDLLSFKAIKTVGLPFLIYNSSAVLIYWIRIIVFPKKPPQPG